MNKPHPFAPRRLAVAVLLALSGPSALAAVDCTVSVANDDGSGDTPNTLSWAIMTANNGATPSTYYPSPHPGGGCTNNTITLATNVTLTGVMKRLIDSDVTLDGQGHTIDGGGSRPLFVKSGTVTIKNMSLNNGQAQGGASRFGGGGAGLGGALFVYSGTVTVRDVTFNTNQALGGQSLPRSTNPNLTCNLGGSGGGMYGNGITNCRGGGGLFANSNPTDSDTRGTLGGYGGTGAYSPPNGAHTSHSFGYGGTGAAITPTSQSGTLPGFGGGGGTGAYVLGQGSPGGFGGGAGAVTLSRDGNTNGNPGGFGGGGSSGNLRIGHGGYGGGDGSGSSSGGSGAGFGGAIFVMRGELTLQNVNFVGNDATGGSGVNPGQGRGGAVFICTANLTDSGTNQAPTQCSGTMNEIDSCGVTFHSNTASTGQPELFWKDPDNTYLDFEAIGATQACPTTPTTPTGPASPIPTLSEWGLLLMSSLLGLFGVWQSRNRAGMRGKRRI